MYRIRKTTTPIILICLIFCFLSAKSQITSPSQQEAKGSDGRYVSWGEWSNTGSRWWDGWYFGVHQTITKEEYFFLLNKRENRDYPEDCPRVVELVDRLYAIVPTAGMDRHKTKEDKEIQKSANGSRNYKDLNFEWDVLDFYKKCKKGQAEWGKLNNSKQSPTNYQVQPNEEESKAIKLLTNFLEHVYTTDIATDDLKMINKGYTVYESGMKSDERWQRPILETKAGKVYFNEETQEIVVPNKPGVKAELKYPDGSVVNLLPGAKISIMGDHTLYIERNGVGVRVVKTGKQFLIRTPTAVCGIRGTEFDIGYYNGITQIKLYEGSLSIFNEKHSIMLMPNEQAEIPSKTAPIKRSKIKSAKKSNSSNGKIPYTLPQAKWIKQNTIDGYYTTSISSSGKEEMVFITGSISSSQYAPNVHRIYYHQKSRSSHSMGSDANGIFSLDRKHIWICGKRGGIAFNENAALEAFWKKQNSGTSLDLNDIYFIDEKNGWCVGNNGTVLYSKNGGNSWDLKSGFIRKHLVGVQFVGNDNGWILCNGTYYPSEMPLIYYTKDGGNNWHPTEVAAGLKNSRMAVNAMWFIDENNGWIVGANNLIMFTKDGGVSWDYYQKAKQGGTNLNDIQFTDPWNGWICGDKGLLMHTIDGGKTWKKETINGETGTFTSLQFNGPYLGWVITNNQIYQYKDEKLYNQFRSKFIKGEWDTWSNAVKNNNYDHEVVENKEKQTDINNKSSLPKEKNTPTSNEGVDNESKTKKRFVNNNQATNTYISNSNVGNSSAALSSFIKSYNVNNQSLSNKIDNDMAGGVSPIGFNLVNNEVHIMYLNQNLFNVQAWAIEYYKTSNEISNGITAKIQNEGYMPMGITSDNKGLYVIFIKGDGKASAWQLVESSQNLREASKNIKPYLDQGFIPVGITLYGDFYYTLLLNVVDSSFKSWQIEGYQSEWNMNNDIKQKINQNKIPFGFLSKEGVFNVLYVGF
jgi:photosystem II stability/assembly factor-like uncharacterized protein